MSPSSVSTVIGFFVDLGLFIHADIDDSDDSVDDSADGGCSDADDDDGDNGAADMNVSAADIAADGDGSGCFGFVMKFGWVVTCQ